MYLLIKQTLPVEPKEIRPRYLKPANAKRDPTLRTCLKAAARWEKGAGFYSRRRLKTTVRSDMCGRSRSAAASRLITENWDLQPTGF